MRYWADSNPLYLHERPLLSPKVTVNTWFQQEGATAYTIAYSIDGCFEGTLSERLIPIKGDLEWTARSPDLSPFPQTPEIGLRNVWRMGNVTCHISSSKKYK